MNRLTERDEFGNADIIGVDSGDLCNELFLADELNKVTDALNKLAAYEDAEEKQAKCKYCTACKDLLDMGDVNVYIIGKQLHLYAAENDASQDTGINYCPVCGRKLTEES